MSSELYHSMLDVNLHGAFYTLREAAPHMRARAREGDPGGSIVACGSLVNLSRTTRDAVYLAPDASRFHTGDILVIDGGRLVGAM
jgi:NAD(P)-dependent dehydrogenase (short-subunit alcohol dehydrogenase family)